MKDYSNSWIEQNPEYEYHLFDDNDINQFIVKEFPEYVSAYKKIKQGAVKADFWRYLILYRYGGVYADIDCRCMVSLKKWIQPEAEWVTQLGINKDVCQWLIISIPGNPVFRRAAQKSYENLTHHNEYSQYRGFHFDGNRDLKLREQAPIKIHHPIMKLAGPPVLQEAAEECFLTPSDAGIFRSIQIVCVSDKVSCQMNGNVIHDYLNQEYIQALKELSTPHYESLLQQTGILERLFYLIRRVARRIYGAMTK